MFGPRIVWWTSLGLLVAVAVLRAGEVPQHIRVPEGFIVEQVAVPPLVTHPMMASFDDQGRLYVADAAGVNLEAEELLRDLPNRMLRLEDTDGDGRFDRQTVFADKLTFPMGSLWYRGAVYVASPPSIWKLIDTNDDGVADVREEFVSKFGFIGNAADIHGCFLGPEGRIYWCDGRHGHEFVDDQGRTISKGKAARIFSCRLDGGQVEAYCGGGMDNPVEVAFSRTGELFGTMTFYNPDDVRHDALVHYLYGGVYPRKHEVVREFARTGDFLPPLVLYDTVAPAGLCRYESGVFGEDYRDNLFSVHFNTHRLWRHRVERAGATFQARDEEFLVSTDNDFHLTDVLEDADGSLLVIDTGGWFRHGCPTSQVAKPEILGAIYRIRRTGVAGPPDPRGLALAWEQASVNELAARLADPRPAVNERAVDELARRGAEAVPTLAAKLDDSAALGEAQLQVVWALARGDLPAGRAVLRRALDHPLAAVRLAAARTLGTARDVEALAALLPRLADEDRAVRREAATALGRLGQSAAVPALLAALAEDPPRSEEHAILFALIELQAPDATRGGLSAQHPLVQRGALIALDQMRDSPLTADDMAPLLDAAEPALRQAALAVLERRPEWSAALSQQLVAWLAADRLDPADEPALAGALAAFASQAALRGAVAERLLDPATPDNLRRLLFDAIASGEPRPLPGEWQHALAHALAADSAELVSGALWAVRGLPREAFRDELARVALRTDLDPRDRLLAWTLVGQGGGALDAAGFDLLLATASRDEGSEQRLAAAEALGQAALTEVQRRRLLPLLGQAGPLELGRMLRGFSRIDAGPARRGWAAELTQVLTEAPAMAALAREDREALRAAWGDEAPALFRESPAATSPATELLASLLASLPPGNPQRGREVFFSPQAACAGCHRIGGDGGAIGPDLSTIGRIRVRRDLVESIALPSASLARGYESYAASTRDGLVHTGVLARETATAIYLRTARRDEIRLAREEVESLSPSPLSVMPEGLDRVLGPESLADLVSYLESLR